MVKVYLPVEGKNPPAELVELVSELAQRFDDPLAYSLFRKVQDRYIQNMGVRPVLEVQFTDAGAREVARVLGPRAVRNPPGPMHALYCRVADHIDHLEEMEAHEAQSSQLRRNQGTVRGRWGVSPEPPDGDA